MNSFDKIKRGTFIFTSMMFTVVFTCFTVINVNKYLEVLTNHGFFVMLMFSLFVMCFCVFFSMGALKFVYERIFKTDSDIDFFGERINLVNENKLPELVEEAFKNVKLREEILNHLKYTEFNKYVDDIKISQLVEIAFADKRTRSAIFSHLEFCDSQDTINDLTKEEISILMDFVLRNDIMRHELLHCFGNSK